MQNAPIVQHLVLAVIVIGPLGFGRGKAQQFCPRRRFLAQSACPHHSSIPRPHVASLVSISLAYDFDFFGYAGTRPLYGQLWPYRWRGVGAHLKIAFDCFALGRQIVRQGYRSVIFMEYMTFVV